MSPAELKRGYDWAYEEFYRWSNIFYASSAHSSFKHQLKHFFYSAGWKKFEPAWDIVIRLKQLAQLRPVLEAILSPVDNSLQHERQTRHTRFASAPTARNMIARAKRSVGPGLHQS